MSRYLIVAHETAMNPDLIERVKGLAADDRAAQFVLLVPATPVKYLLRRTTGTDAEVLARKRVEEAKRAFAKAGLQVETRIGGPSPLEAIADEVRAHPGYDGFVISTLPDEHSRWLRMDLPRKVEQQYGLPVIHVKAQQDQMTFFFPPVVD